MSGRHADNDGLTITADVRDELGILNLTSLPRTKWAKIRQTMLKSAANRRSLHSITSAISLVILDTSAPDEGVGVAREWAWLESRCD